MDANEQDKTRSTSDSTMNEAGKTGGQAMSAADQAYQKSKEKVGKGVATAAGAVDGFNEKMEEHDVAGQTKNAIKTAGETTREVAGTAAKQVTQTKEHVKSKAEEGKTDY